MTKRMKRAGPAEGAAAGSRHEWIRPAVHRARAGDAEGRFLIPFMLS